MKSKQCEACQSGRTADVYVDGYHGPELVCSVCKKEYEESFKNAGRFNCRLFRQGNEILERFTFMTNWHLVNRTECGRGSETKVSYLRLDEHTIILKVQVFSCNETVSVDVKIMESTINPTGNVAKD